MGILIDENTKVIVQGITGKQGSFHTKQMLAYGTKIVAGVTPGKKGQEVEGVSVFDSVGDALEEHDAEWSVIFVPSMFVKGAALEALGHGLNIVIITENTPVHDILEVMAIAEKKNLTVIGPNCPGMATVGKCKLGIMPNHIFKEGNVGIVSRSGTLTYELVGDLTKRGIGQSTVIGLGGDPVTGLNFIDALKLFAEDENTDTVILVGEIGGDIEEKTADFLKGGYPKKVVAYIAGVTAPEGKKMGHAGAIISGNSGTAQGKIKAFEEAGVKVAKIPSEVAELIL